MKAARLYAKGDLRIEDIPMPGKLLADEVLLEVEAAGICGSDLHNFHTGMWISRTPSTPGHELVGTVLDAGTQVKDLSPGDRVVADSRMPCGQCSACISAKRYLCDGMGFVGELNDGGFAPYSIQKSTQVLKLPDQNIDAETAVLCEPLAVALHAVNRVAPVPGDSAVVMGAGTIGVLCAIVLRHRGVEDIRIVEANPIRKERVCEMFGFRQFSDTEAIRATVCIDATGSPAALKATLSCVARGGRVSVVGLYAAPLEIDMNAIVEGGITLLGCAAFDNELIEAVLLVTELKHELRKLSTVTIDVDSIPEWYQTLSSYRNHVQKVIVVHQKK